LKPVIFSAGAMHFMWWWELNMILKVKYERKEKNEKEFKGDHCGYCIIVFQTKRFHSILTLC